MKIRFTKQHRYRSGVALVSLALVLSIAMSLPVNAAIAFRAASSGNNAGGATTLTVPKPTGVTLGDVMVATISARGGTGTTITPPSNWNLINSNDSTTVLKSSTYYKAVTASEASSYSWTFSASVKASGVISAYSGVDTGAPIMADGSQANDSSASMTSPSVTTTATNAWIIAGYSTARGTTVSAGSSMTLRGQDASTGAGSTSRTTTGLQDVSQAAIGASGAKTMTAANAAVNIGHTIALRPPAVVSQSAYRFFGDSSTSGQVGSALAAQDTAIVAPSAGSPVRLRLALTVDEQNLATTKAFKLQFAYNATAQCSNASYYDVTSTSIIKYYDNTNATDAASLTSDAGDPTVSGYTKVLQTYEEANSFTVATQVNTSQAGVWDFNLTTGSNIAVNGSYCLRATWADGTPLSSYSTYPMLFVSTTGTELQQQSSRLYQNADSLTPGSALAATDTKADLSSSNQAFRARVGGSLRLGLPQIAAGANHTCAIASDNQAYCWGDNSGGQLGNNSTTDSLTPVPVSTTGVLAGKTILSITAGYAHTCVIASDNQAYCWGQNTYGQIGDNTSGTNRLVPTAVYTAGVLSGKTILSITAGYAHTCVIASDNQAYCWGQNTYGQIGDNTSGTNRLVPTAVYTAGALSGKTILSISTGSYHTCAIASDNQTYCWGWNIYGQIGDNTSGTSRLVPTTVLVYYFNPAVFAALPGQASFTLQYATKTAYSCRLQTGFSAVGTTTPIAFNNNASISSGQAISRTASDPNPNGNIVAQSYIETTGSFSNIATMYVGQTGLWDFSLKDNGAPGSTTYCLRLATSSGSALNTYSSYVEVRTAASTGGGGGPTLNQQLRGGGSVIQGVKNSLTW